MNIDLHLTLPEFEALYQLRNQVASSDLPEELRFDPMLEALWTKLDQLKERLVVYRKHQEKYDAEWR